MAKQKSTGSGRSISRRQALDFRSALLVGASVCAIATLSSGAYAQTAPAADKPKWQPDVTVGGQAGDQASGAEAIGFDPVWQDLDSLLYVRLGLGTPTHQGWIGNVGVGYRTKIDGDWILGGYGGFDFTNSRYDHSFSQASLGAEAMSADWDVRLNGYISLTNKPRDIAGAAQLYIHDTTIAILQGQETAYSGFDGEVGYRVYSTDNLNVRLFGGGFSYTRSNPTFSVGGKTFHLGPGDIQGPMGRLEVEFDDIATFGKQSRITLSGQINHDDVRGTNGYVGATLRIPLDVLDTDDSDQDDLDHRMVDPVRRRDSILTEAGYSKPEPVIMYNGTITSEPTNTLYYVDNHTGAGSYADPTTLHDATSRGPHNQFIVLTDRDGAVDSTGVTVQPGESVVGPGTFTVRGAVSGRTFTHDFAPGSGPVTVNTADGITLGSNTNLFGFTIDSTAPNAIYGHNVNDVVIGGVTIAGGGVTNNGIYIHQDDGSSGSVTIDNTTISGVVQDGIKVTVANATGSTASFNLNVTGANIDAGQDGINVTSTTSGGSNETIYAGIHNSTVSGGTNDVIMSGTVFAGSTLNQTLVVDPTHLSGGLYGVVASGTANGGQLTQSITLDEVYITGTTTGGVLINGYALNAGTLNQTVTLDRVSVTGSFAPIYVGVSAIGTGSVATQNVTMDHVTASNGTYDNIELSDYAGYGGTGHQYATLTNIVAINSRYGSGVLVHADSYEDATVIQNVTIDSLTATGNHEDGLHLYALAGNLTPGASATTAQYVSVSDSYLVGNGYGVLAVVSASDDSIARQDITVSNSTLNYNAYYGFKASANAAFAGTAEQHVFLNYDDVSYNGESGAGISALAFYLGSVEQTAQIYGGTFDSNGGDGITISAQSFSAGQIQQNVGIYYATAAGNARDGLSISSNAYGYALGFSPYYSHVSQNVTAVYDYFSNNRRNGVEINNYAGYGAQLNQFVYLYSDHMNQNGPTSGPVPLGAGNGFYETSLSEAYGTGGGAITTNLYSDVYVVGTTADLNRMDGLRIKGSQDGPGYTIQHIQVQGSVASYNGRTGFVAYDDASNFYSLNIQYITLAGSKFGGNALDGAAFLATQHYGPLSFGAAIQDVTLASSSFNYNGRDGLYASADAYAQQGRAEQHFTIDSSRFEHNGSDGAHFYNNAHDGVYLTGYDCTVAQGLNGGCAFVRQTVSVNGSIFDHNNGDGIYIGSHADTYGAVYGLSGRPANSPTLLMEYSDASGNGGDGLHIENHASNYSYIYSYAVLLGSTFNGNSGHGIEVNSGAYSGSTVLQKTVLYGVPGYQTTASGNGSDGLHVYSTATGGTVQQLVGVYNSELSGNTLNGLYVGAHVNGGSAAYPSVVGQYINILGSTLSYNGGDGARFQSSAHDAFGATSQQVSAEYSTFDNNGVDGLHAFEVAYNTASANQNLYFAADDFSYNTGDGVYAVGTAVSQSSTKQIVNFGYHTGFTTVADGNTGDGIYIGTAAFSGANAYQAAFVYDVDASHNGHDGLELASSANGYSFGSSYIYYSHVGQNLVAAYDTFNHNARNGVSVNNTVYYGGATNQAVEVISSEANYNGHAGFYSVNHLTSIRGGNFSFSTNLSSDLYLIGTTTNHNVGNGIDIRSYANGAVYAPAFFGGYNYMEMHNTVQGVTSEYNGGAGLSMNTNTTGRYSLNAEYVTITGSTLDRNIGAGATFTSTDSYGPGGFGVSLQQITISGSDFSYNGADGLDLSAFSSGRQGRAEQHVTATGSSFDYNGGDGVHIYASATDGVYIAGHPCTAVQGLAGGCAFVRQNVTIVDSGITHNTNNGVFVGTYANSYGAIYGVSGRPHAPTMELYGSTVDYNGGRGLDVSNHASNHSYIYQYNANIDSVFDHNSSDGIYSASYVGGASTMLQRNLLYSFHTVASGSYNAGNGFKSSIEALGGSYARDVNIVEGVNLSHDGSFGLDGAVAYADGTSTGLQINGVYSNTVDHNGDGIGLYSIGSGAQQISYIGDNEIRYNSFVGAYGEANFGAFQYIGIYNLGGNPAGNIVNSNGTNYLFNHFGGSTQVLH